MRNNSLLDICLPNSVDENREDGTSNSLLLPVGYFTRRLTLACCVSTSYARRTGIMSYGQNHEGTPVSECTNPSPFFSSRSHGCGGGGSKYVSLLICISAALRSGSRVPSCMGEVILPHRAQVLHLLVRDSKCTSSWP